VAIVRDVGIVGPAKDCYRILAAVPPPFFGFLSQTPPVLHYIVRIRILTVSEVSLWLRATDAISSGAWMGIRMIFATL
jgi:hypothetical protein